jgi:hypothetical protein
MQAKFYIEDSTKYASIAIGESDILFGNQMWKINPALINLRKGNISINDLSVNSNDSYYRLHGIISANKSDTLHLDFNGINLASLNNLSESVDPDRLKLSIGGELSGRVLLTGLLGELMLETDNVVVESFQLMDHSYGNLFLKSVWDNNQKVAGITLYNDLDGVRAIDIEGTYNPENMDINLSARADRLPINILNPLLSSFASGIKGYATGKVVMSGKINQPELNGSLLVNEGSLRVNYLQTTYFFNDTIRFNSQGIVFRNITALDDRDNPIKIDGIIKHRNFKDYGVDLTFNPVAAKVLDTKIKDNDIFYGTAFASGVITIKSDGNNMAFDISARTDRNTRFFVPMNSTQSMGDYSFVTFTGSDLPIDKDKPSVAKPAESSTGSTISLNFDLDVTPDAEVQLVLDAKAGDVMRGRGAGKLNIVMTPKGDFSISGDYIISSGDYLFTLGNILNKRFTVDDGSRISWNGEITEADIDITARYRLEASLFDLLQDERFRERIPVECILHMTDRLINPSIDFEINLPTADEQTRSYLRNAINTDEEMSRQFVYLLVMNRFYPDPAYRSGSNADPTSGAGSSALGNTMEMVSNQLTNWLSQISNDFDVGFVYRPGNEISTQEVELALSTQLLNDRVTINGNFDVGAGQNNSSATTVTGVFDVEFTITEKLKFKFFNRSNDNIL